MRKRGSSSWCGKWITARTLLTCAESLEPTVTSEWNGPLSLCSLFRIKGDPSRLTSAATSIWITLAGVLIEKRACQHFRARAIVVDQFRKPSTTNEYRSSRHYRQGQYGKVPCGLFDQQKSCALRIDGGERRLSSQPRTLQTIQDLRKERTTDSLRRA